MTSSSCLISAPMNTDKNRFLGFARGFVRGEETGFLAQMAFCGRVNSHAISQKWGRGSYVSEGG